MKKILFASLTLFTLVILGTGCLKDKDYENQAYGTQVQSGSGVGFPAALKSLSLDLGIVSSAGVDSILGPFIALESSPRSSDVHVNLEIVVVKTITIMMDVTSLVHILHVYVCCLP